MTQGKPATAPTAPGRGFTADTQSQRDKRPTAPSEGWHGVGLDKQSKEISHGSTMKESLPPLWFLNAGSRMTEIKRGPWMRRAYRLCDGIGYLAK